MIYTYDAASRISKMTDQLGRYKTYAYYSSAEIAQPPAMASRATPTAKDGRPPSSSTIP